MDDTPSSLGSDLPAHLLAAVEALAEEQVPEPVIVKGQAAARQVYRNPCHRIGVDIDLLVHERDFDRTLEVLRAAGFRSATSASLLQRRLGIGYTRASRLMDIMGEKGLVGPYKGSKAREAYGDDIIVERHRHRFEVNNQFIEDLEKAGLVVSGRSVDNSLVEMVELSDHPWFIGCQFHPEFTSQPREGHPLFTSFISAAVEYHQAHS